MNDSTTLRFPIPTVIRMPGLATVLNLALLLIATALPAPHATALDREHRLAAEAAIDRGVAFLRSTQAPDGAWTPKPGPAVTALALSVLLDQPDIDTADPAVNRAVDYILGFRQPDGGIYRDILSNYNTAIAVSALSRISHRPDVAEAVDAARDYLISIQWGATPGQSDPNGRAITPDHPWYGGSGYGNRGRPDMSNTHFMVQALYDSGLNCEDPAYRRAVVFIQRCQGVEANDLFGPDVVTRDGGFIYSTTLDKDHIGVPESKANPEMADEAKAGRPVSGLRSYGSITYAAFKSYVYANLDAEDPRVTAAWEWISRHYDPNLDANPGLPEPQRQQGLYYFYMTMGRALSAWGETYIQARRTAHDSMELSYEEPRDWANDLIDAVVSRQRDDGSWVNEADRWMEGDPNLATTYALIALTEAVGR